MAPTKASAGEKVMPAATSGVPPMIPQAANGNKKRGEVRMFVIRPAMADKIGAAKPA